MFRRPVVRALACGVLVLLCVVSGSSRPTAQTQTLIQTVRAALNRQDFVEAERTLADAKTRAGMTPEWLEAHSWLGRGALAAKQYKRAEAYATQTYALVQDALKSRALDQEAHLPIALGAAIEVQGHAAAEAGARSEGVAYLNQEFEKYKTTSIAKRIQKNLNLLTLEGTVAPALDRSEGFSSRRLQLADVKGKVAIVFFWAHWCPDCKRQAPILSALLDKYRDQGLTIVAPTQRYGYVAGGRTAGAEEENKYIASVRDTYYGFLPDDAVTISEANHVRYGVSTTPTLVLLDRQGIVRAYHPGNMTAEELDALIVKYLNAR